MGYHAEENKFVPITEANQKLTRDWTKFTEDEHVLLKGVVFRVHEVGESRLVLKPLKREQ